MLNPEKLVALGTQYAEKHNTMCAGHHHTQSDTNNINKTWTLPQTTGGKAEQNKPHLGKHVNDCHVYMKNVNVLPRKRQFQNNNI